MKEDYKVRILLVNDEAPVLNSLKSKLEKECSDKISISIFGPNEARSNNVGLILLNELKKENSEIIDKHNYDVLFVDYAMPGLNGIQFLRLLNAEPLLNLPVVLITKNDEEMMKAVIKKAIDLGARGYIFSDNERYSGNFGDEVTITAQRVYQECQRERWSEALMEISSTISSVKNENELYDLFISILKKQNKHIKVFIRKLVDKQNGNNILELKAVSNVPKEKVQPIYFLNSSELPMVHNAANGKIDRYNSLKDRKQEMNEESYNLCKSLGLDRGMCFPIKNAEGKTTGTISMYRREIDPPFSLMEEKYANLIVNSISTKLQLDKSFQYGEAYIQFINNFTKCVDEDQLFAELVRHLHKEINKASIDSQNFKTTFKLLKPGTDKLFCQKDKGHHLGAIRNHEYQPSIYSEKSISAFVARTNQYKIVPNFREEEKYVSTNTSMVSELCIPVSKGTNDSVIGVVNLESSIEDFYSIERAEYALALCRLTGHYAERLRFQKFLHEILMILGGKKDSNYKIKKSIKIIKELTGYQILIFVLRQNEKWVVADSDLPNLEMKPKFNSLVSDRLNGNEPMLIKHAFNENKNIFYIEDISTLHSDIYWTPDSIFLSGENQRSQIVFLLKLENKVVGALSLDFIITNPLTSDVIEILQKFTFWLEDLFLETERFEKGKLELSILNKEAAFAELVAQTWHLIKSGINTSKNIVYALMQNYENSEDSNLLESLRTIDNRLFDLNLLPNRVKSLGNIPEIQIVEIIPIWNKVIEEISEGNKAKSMKFSIKNELGYIKTDPGILEMILFNLIDNSIAACKNEENPIIEISCEYDNEKYKVILIKDNGIGIKNPEDAIQPNYTTKSNGLGYGLFWVDKRVKEMNGYFSIERLEKGTLAAIYLPN